MHAYHEDDYTTDLSLYLLNAARTLGACRDAYWKLSVPQDMGVHFDYILGGNVRLTREEGREFTYGLSLLAFVPWLLGAPQQRYTVRLEMDVTLTGSSGKTDKLTIDRSSEQKWLWLYDGNEASYDMFVDLGRAQIDQFIQDHLGEEAVRADQNLPSSQPTSTPAGGR